MDVGGASAIRADADRHQAHDRATARLRASYEAMGPRAPVRLSKHTSNLFRPRSKVPGEGLDVSELGGVIAVNPDARTAVVQGMATYERIVDATLPYGLMPRVVPQLRTITLGGAVTGLGIESTSFRHGLPHESVLEMDVLTGAGEIVTASAEQHADLFAAFPNSYGSLGYALRLTIELQPIAPYIALRHVRFEDLDQLTTTIEQITLDHTYDGEPVEFLDGVMFDPEQAYLTLGRGVDHVAEAGLLSPSDYTGRHVYYRSIPERSRDVLTAYDYLWRWDTDWFWCSRAFGAQHPIVRRLWPARYRRSDVYHRLVGLEHRFGVARRIDRLRRKPAHERVVQDVELPIEQTADFLRWFDANVAMRPVWLCPLRLRESGGPGSAREWPLYPLRSGKTYVNVGFWGQVPITRADIDGAVNIRIEQAVAARAGHKSLYSDAYYEEADFYATYGGATYQAAKHTYDPDQRLTGLYEKAVRRR